MPVYSNWIKRLNLKFSVAVKGDRGSSPCAGVNASIAKWIRQRSTKPWLGVRLSLLALYRLKIKKKNLKFLKIFDKIYLVNEKKLRSASGLSHATFHRTSRVRIPHGVFNRRIKSNYIYWRGGIFFSTFFHHRTQRWRKKKQKVLLNCER